MLPLVMGIYPNLRVEMAKKKEISKDLCSILGVSDDTVRRKLKGLAEFTLSEVTALSKHYEVSIDELMANPETEDIPKPAKKAKPKKQS